MQNPKTDNVDERKFEPIFSVIIPTYNRAHLVTRSIQSVLNQTFSQFELIVVDDGSTDNTDAEVKSIKDIRIRYIYQENRGRSAARNTGVTHAKGLYITFLDSDDEALPEWLEHFAQEFEKPGTSVVCCGVVIKLKRDYRQKALTLVRLPQNRGPVYENQKGLFLTGTFALHRELFKTIGGYQEELHFSENTDLALRLTTYCTQTRLKIVNVIKPLVVFHNSRPIAAPENYQVRLESAEYILRHHGERYRQHSPRGYTNYCAIAGTSAARLGKYHKARHYFLSAIRVYPWNWKHYGRLFLALIFPLGRKLWLRHQ